MKRTIKINEKQINVDSDASADEILALAKQEGVELSDEQLEQVSGGLWENKVIGTRTMPSEITQWITCDTCGGKEIQLTVENLEQGYVDCPGCGTRYML